MFGRKKKIFVPLFGMAISGITYLLRDEHTTDLSAGSVNGTANEPGPGLRTLVDTGNLVNISGGKIVFNGATGANDPLLYDAAGMTRVAGRTFVTKVTVGAATARVTLGFGSTPPSYPHYGLGVYLSPSNVIVLGEGAGNGLSLSALFSPGDEVVFTVVLWSAGGAIFAKGGALTGQTLLGTFDTSTITPVYPGIGMAAATASVNSFDYRRVVDLPAPFNVDRGIAVVNQTSFTQALGENLVSNGTFDGGTISPWSVWLTPPTCEESSGRLHVIGDENNDGANSSGFTPSSGFAELSFDLEISSVTATGVNIYVAGSVSTLTFTGTGTFSRRARIAVSGASTAVFTQQVGAGGVEWYLDNVVVKQLTLNSEQTAVTDGEFNLSFTLPGTPAYNETVELWYRANGDQNYWRAYLLRNSTNTAWDFRLDSVSNGTATNRINVTGVGTPTQIRVYTNGSTIDCYTLEGTTWTKRGSTITNTTHATNKGARAVYSSTVTPVRLAAHPRRTISTYDLLTTGVGDTLPTYAEVASFTESLGSELITNGTFTSVLTPWSTRGTPTTLEVSSDRLHVVADGLGEGALVTLAGGDTPPVGWYEFAYDIEVISAVGGTGANVYVSNTNGTPALAHGVGANVTRRILWYSPTEIARGVVWETTTGITAAEYYGDNVTLKPVTLNAQQTSTADGAAEFYFTLPASPAIGERASLWYRGNGEADYWTAYVARNASNTAWDFYLDSVSSGTATNSFSVTGLGITPQGIRIETNGNYHNVFVYDGTDWIKMGTTVSSATHASNMGVRAVYASTVTPTLLRYTV